MARKLALWEARKEIQFGQSRTDALLTWMTLEDSSTPRILINDKIFHDEEVLFFFFLKDALELQLKKFCKANFPNGFWKAVRLVKGDDRILAEIHHFCSLKTIVNDR